MDMVFLAAAAGLWGVMVLLDRQRFAGQHGFIQRAAAFQDHAVNRHLLAGTHPQAVAFVHIGQGSAFTALVMVLMQWPQVTSLTSNVFMGGSLTETGCTRKYFRPFYRGKVMQRSSATHLAARVWGNRY